MRVRSNTPGIKPHLMRVFGLLKDCDENSFPAEQIAEEMCLVDARVRAITAKHFGEDFASNTGKVLERASARKDHDFFRKFSDALKSPIEFQITLTESFLLFFWAHGSFAFTDKDSFPPLVLFTVRDLSQLMQAVFETAGLTESSLEATIGRKLQLKTIKHCKITHAQAERWIQQFKAYKAKNSAQIKDRLDMWGSFLQEQQCLNSVCKKTGMSPAEAKDFIQYFLRNREALRRAFKGKHSDKGSKQPRRHV